jgi:predicted permease
VADWQAGTRTLAAVGVARDRGLQIRRGETRVDVFAAMATPGFLEALGVRPLHGRLLREDDMLPHGSGSVVVLSHELWQTEFGGDPRVVGQTLIVSSGGDGRVLKDDPVTVVGILPEGVEAPRLTSARAWFPLQQDPRAPEIRGWRGFVTLARLAPGATLATAAEDLNRIQGSLAEAYPDDVRNWHVEAHAALDFMVRGIRPLLLLFLAAVAVVLVIVCVNVMGLLLARAMQRERELTVRAALGARRGDLVRQLMVETVALAALGGAAGVLLASWLVAAFVALAPSGIPRLADVTIDRRILGFSVLLTGATALLAGLAPALRVRGLQLHDSLKEVRTTAGRRGTSLRRALVVAQLR